MRKKFVAAVMTGVAALTLADVPSLRAEDTANWSTVGDWNIGAFRKTGFGCFMGTQYSRGTTLVLGFGPKGGGYVGVSNDAWGSLEAGKEYPLSLKFNDGTSWRGTATGVGNPVLLVLSFYKPEFVADFATKQSVSIEYAGRSVTQLPLRGTYAAVQELVSCQETMIRDRDGPARRDPFESDRDKPGAGSRRVADSSQDHAPE